MQNVLQPEVKAAGAELSLPGLATEGWQQIRVPNTIVGALVARNVYPDPYSA